MTDGSVDIEPVEDFRQRLRTWLTANVPRTERRARRFGIVLPAVGSALERRQDVQKLPRRCARRHDANRRRGGERCEIRLANRP